MHYFKSHTYIPDGLVLPCCSGAGECGKSTILKQMKILHQIKFTAEEKEMYRKLVRSNTLEAIQTLLVACENLGIPLDSAETEERGKKLMQYNYHQDFPLTIQDDIVQVWKDSGIQKAVARSSEFQFLDSGPL